MSRRSTISGPEAKPARRVLAGCGGAFAALALFSLCINLLVLTVPLYMIQLFSRVLASRSEETLVMLTIVAAGALAVMGMLEAVRSRLLLRLSAKIDRALSSEALIASVSGAVRGAGHSIQALRDLSRLRTFLTGSGVLALVDVPWSPILLFVIWLLHPFLGVLAFAGAFVLFLLAIFNEVLTRRPLDEANDASGAAYRRAEASVRNAEVVEAMGLLPGLLKRWARDNARALSLQARASARSGNITALARSLRTILQIGIFGAGAYLVIEQEVNAGVMLAAALLTARALSPIQQAIGTWRDVVHARAAYKRLNEKLAATPPRGVAMELPKPQGWLSVEKVVYGPPGVSPPILKGVNFDLPAGQALGVVGPTAAGKSTLARLLVGAWRPSYGTVRLDGADVFTWDREDFGRHVGYLPQDIELFEGTVRDNIARFGEAEAEDIVEAAKLGGVHEMILRLPEGYETEIGEGGEFLSAGQRQRLALARALLGPPRLVVLDEPNSNLDTDGEVALLHALEQCKAQGTTVVIIAHRPSIIQVVDKVLMLRNGVVEAFGAREQVLERIARPGRLAEVAQAGNVARIAAAPKSGERP